MTVYKNPVTETIKLSIACELLATRISTMEVHLRENRGDYSREDVEDYLRAAEFLNEHYRKHYDLSDAKTILESL